METYEVSADVLFETALDTKANTAIDEELRNFRGLSEVKSLGLIATVGQNRGQIVAEIDAEDRNAATRRLQEISASALVWCGYSIANTSITVS